VVAGRRLVRFLRRHVEDIQLAAGGGLSGGGDTGVVGDMITIDDVVIPVSLASLESRVLEAERSFPGTRLGRRLVLGEWELTNVIVPRAEKVHSLDARRDAKRERKLNSRHFRLPILVVGDAVE